MPGLRHDFAALVSEALGPMAQRLRFLDECGVHLGLTRLGGRAAPGERVVEGTPGYSGPPDTVIAALGADGVPAPWVWEGARTDAAFETSVEGVLAPTLRPGAVVLMDHLSAPKGERVRAAIEGRGARLEYLPPYSPDRNPIEKCWSKVKAALPAAKTRSFDALLDALRAALRDVSSEDAAAWFAHCGYAGKP